MMDDGIKGKDSNSGTTGVLEFILGDGCDHGLCYSRRLDGTNPLKKMQALNFFICESA